MWKKAFNDVVKGEPPWAHCEVSPPGADAVPVLLAEPHFHALVIA